MVTASNAADDEKIVNMTTLPFHWAPYQRNPQWWFKAESRDIDMISASWTDKHISILHVYF